MHDAHNCTVLLLHSVSNSGLELIAFSKIGMLSNTPHHGDVLLFCSSDTICRALCIVADHMVQEKQ